MSTWYLAKRNHSILCGIAERKVAVIAERRARTGNKDGTYDFLHDGSAYKSVKETDAPKERKKTQCGRCKMVTRQHNGRNCPYNPKPPNEPDLGEDSDGQTETT